MLDAKIGAILVMEGGKILGIWTERDLTRNTIQDGFDPSTARIRDHMVKDVLFKSLNKKERVVIQNYYYEGLSMREIAGMLRLTESRVCQIHSKVIKRLRELHASKRTELFV